ncbi:MULTISPECIES: DUF6428 family protein [unclassified Ruegeria]|uniref:DUF6428 family protein n=1 Tax=unclassified Ruegeria TaxID=2625375 RepID=UPI001489A3EC|nr:MULTISPECIES: DUF6428 family protein [unclassified Ruegeria]
MITLKVQYISRIIEMKGSEMNFSTLLSALKSCDPDAKLVFMSDGREIGAGYHVTELRHSSSKGIDCGGNIETWDEARLQLLDGAGDSHMSVGKFSAIVSKSLKSIPELSHASLHVEFSPDNIGLNLKTMDAPEPYGNAVVIQLHDARALCKPAQRSALVPSATSGCCGSTKAAATCCA